jgi:hypothetical protein
MGCWVALRALASTSALSLVALGLGLDAGVLEAVMSGCVVGLQVSLQPVRLAGLTLDEVVRGIDREGLVMVIPLSLR